MSSHTEKDLDCTNCSRGLWLVKVPKYIRESWFEAPHNADVGRLRITKTPGGDSTIPEVEKVYMEGQVIQKFECQPIVDSNYLRLKSETAKKASMPERRAVKIDRPAKTYKPLNIQKHLKELEERKKLEGKKARDDRDKVQEMLFSAFEKHQYYNIKDLQKITKQPIAYLREILQEVCIHNLKNPHKNMWELKPEYRHYKQDVAPSSTDS